VTKKEDKIAVKPKSTDMYVGRPNKGTNELIFVCQAVWQAELTFIPN